MKTVILAILDGWGLGPRNETNPIYVAEPETIEYIEKYYPAGSLNASGISVGLPWGEEGNSEVGHLTLGSGRVLYQHFMKITQSIKDGDFFKNEALKKSFNHAKENNSSVHLIGLLTEGNVHASIEHLKSLIEMADKEGLDEVYLDLFSDGRDSPPKSVKKLLKEINKEIENNNIEGISSLSGRYYAMDREGRWDRIEKAYKAIVGEGEEGEMEESIKKNYDEGLNDEHIKPVMIKNKKHVRDGDSIIFFNFREDSMNEITQSFVDDEFSEFKTKNFENLQITTMTQYNDDFDVDVVFPPEEINNTLGEAIAKAGKNQLRVAETEKGAHVTYFFNGLKEGSFDNEYRILIPSMNVGDITKHPGMQAESITERVVLSMQEGTFDFILVNYANPDVIAHTGDYNATVEAIKKVDREINKLIKATIEGGHTLLITSDHGNSELLFDPKTGQSETKHNTSPVPVYVVDKKFQNSKLGKPGKLPKVGMLADIAPTVLDLMNIEKPPEMTGSSFIDIL